MTYQKIGASETEGAAPAIRLSLSDIVAEYEEKRAGITEAVNNYAAAYQNAKTLTSVRGEWGGSVTSDRGQLYPRDLEAALLKSAWKHVYKGLQIEAIASAKDRALLEQRLCDPEPFTLENIRETFADYLLAPRYHILKGLAECFCDLDPAYKSHDKVKVGVAGLPKRIIVSGCGEYSSYGRDRILDTLNAIDAYKERERMSFAAFDRIYKAALTGADPEHYGVKLRRFQNGNCHMFFDKWALLDINRALAEFYGDVLPDSPEAAAEHKTRTGTALTKDLAYYPTPQPVIERVLRDVRLEPDMCVLEPSCGDGRFIRAILAQEPRARVTGIEVHAARAFEAQQAGCNVMVANFLETEPDPRFDLVVMNPPFCGKTYQKHVDHARKFLKPRGRLVAILPATAHLDHGFCGDPTKRWNPCWSDLPLASFKDSGTTVNTGIYTWRAPE